MSFFFAVLAIAILLTTQGASALERKRQPLNPEDVYTLRDPFSSPTIVRRAVRSSRSGLEMFPLSSLKLTGVITGPKRMKAMLAAPNGKSYFVSMNDPVGQLAGRVVSIKPDSVRIQETQENFMGEVEKDLVELRLGGEMINVTDKR